VQKPQKTHAEKIGTIYSVIIKKVAACRAALYALHTGPEVNSWMRYFILGSTDILRFV